MAIDVTCPGCLTRFQVSEKFAGKTGPCPKCKVVIKVPEKKDEVVIHAPESFGPKDSKGQAVLKPISRKEVRLSTPVIAGIVGAVLLVLMGALVLRVTYPKGSTPLAVQIVFAVLLAPPLSFAGYTFLRDDELEPYRGTSLLVRLIPTTIVYPALWGAYWLVFHYLGTDPNWQILCAVVPVAVAIGAVTSQASLDLEFGSAAFHYTFYLVVTVLLRVLLGMEPHWNVVT